MRFPIAFVLAPLVLAGCDMADPLGLYPAQAQAIVAPLELTGRVVDQADLLTSAQEEDLTQQLAKLQQDKGAQFVVVTTPDLQGMTIADYALMLGRGWQIGSAQRNDGVLLVVAPNERKVRIELGYGIEDYISDPLAEEILDEDILPHMREGNMARGIIEGAQVIDHELRSRLPEFGPEAAK